METFGIVFAVLTSIAFWAVVVVTAIRIFRVQKNSTGKANRPVEIFAARRGRFFRGLLLSDGVKVLAFGLGIRMLFLAAGYIFLQIGYDRPVSIFHAFMRGDSRHYITLAQTGYAWTENGRNILLVFFPLYGYLIRAANFIIRDYIASAYFVSFVSYAVGLLYLFKLVLLDYSKRVAWWAVVLISIAPPAFFFGVPMTESLMLMTSTITLYYIRTHKWAKAGIFGAFAVLTRMVGVVLFAAAIAELLTHRHEIKKAAGILIMPVGGLIYLFINRRISGDPFRFMYYQRSHWFNTTQYFGQTVAQQFSHIVNFEGQALVNTIFIPNLLAFAFAIILLVYACAKLHRPAYIVYALGYIFVSFSPAWLLSGARYVLVCVPLFIFLAVWVDEKPALQPIVPLAFLAGLYFQMTAFITGGPVF